MKDGKNVWVYKERERVKYFEMRMNLLLENVMGKVKYREIFAEDSK